MSIIRNRRLQKFIGDQLSQLPKFAGSFSRQLFANHTVGIVRIRRSVDSMEQDFTESELNDGTYRSFVGLENLFLRSQEFDDAAWSKGSGLSITANAGTDPLGGSTADMLNTLTAANNFLYQSITTVGLKTISIYAKIGTNRYLWVYGGATGSNYGALFDLQNGVVTTTNTNGSVFYRSTSMETVGSGWYRCSITFQPASHVYQAFSSTNNSSPTYSANNDVTNGTAGNIFIWGAQLQTDGLLGAYQATTSAGITRTGFIKTIYDQSGTGNDLTQTITTAQPSLVNVSGKFQALYDNADFLSKTTPGIVYNTHYFGGVFSPSAALDIAGTGGITTGNVLLMVFSVSTAAPRGHFWAVSGLVVRDYAVAYTLNTNSVFSQYGTGSALFSGRNGLFTTSIGYSGTASAPASLILGGRSGATYTGMMSEFWVFDVNLTTDNRQLLERNQGTFYNFSVS